MHQISKLLLSKNITRSQAVARIADTTIHIADYIVIVHCVQKKTPTHIFFHILMIDVLI